MEEALSSLFRSQHGVAAERQLRAVGVTWEQQRGLARRGVLQEFAPGVLAMAGAAKTWEQRAMAATLGTEGLVLLDAGAAARLHRLDGFATHESLALVVPYGTNVQCAKDVAVTRSRRLSVKDRHVVAKIPTVTLPVTLLRLAATGRDPAQALDSALRRRVSPLWLRQNFERWRGPGVQGPLQCLRLLEERMGKRLAHRALREHLILMEEEWPVHDERGSLVAELDLAMVELKVGVECQSIQYHASAADVKRDVARRRLLRRLGWDIIELWWSDLDRMDEVLADIRLGVNRATSSL